MKEHEVAVNAKVAIIGGSGIDKIPGLREVRSIMPKTPYGYPSDAILVGFLKGVNIAFLRRHGPGHSLAPSELPFRANIYALKSIGVEYVVSISAVGSLREDLHPLEVMIPDQLIDHTSGRTSTFFGDGLVAHVSFAEPFCPILRRILYQSTLENGFVGHQNGTYVVIEGPAFSTTAESRLYRSWGADVVGMTALPEAKLAKEAELCYATLACITDYDCWHDSKEVVTAEMVLNNLVLNIESANAILHTVLSHIPQERHCRCHQALENAIVTNAEYITPEVHHRLSVFIDKYINLGGD